MVALILRYVVHFRFCYAFILFLPACFQNNESANKERLAINKVIVNAENIARTAQSSLLLSDAPAWDFDFHFTKATQEIGKIIPHVTGDTLLKCIGEVQKLSPDISLQEARIIPVTGDFFSGVSGNPVSYLSDSSGKPLAIVKAFSGESTSFSKEIAGLALRNELTIGKSDKFYIKYLAQCKTSNSLYYISIYSVAKGATVQEIIAQSYINKKLTENDRAVAFDRAKNAVSTLGSVIAELHKTAVREADYLDPNLARQYLSFFNNELDGLKKMDNFFDGIDVDKFVANFYVNFELLKKSKLRYGYTHGDAHLGNFIYDWDNKLLTLIDLDRLPLSATPDGIPIGLPAFDFLLIEANLFIDFFGTDKLSETDGELLEKLFKENYSRAGGILPSSIERKALEPCIFMWQGGWPDGHKRFKQYLLENFPLAI